MHETHAASAGAAATLAGRRSIGPQSFRPWRWRKLAIGLWAGLSVICGYGDVSWADEIKLGGFWIKDVSIQGIEDGQVLYFNRVGTEFVRPIEQVQDLRLSAYPQLGQAGEAIELGDDRTAQQALEQVRSKAVDPWLRQWVCRLLVGVYDRLNMPHEAVNIYLLLFHDSAPRLYLAQPPLQSVRIADPQVRHTLGQRITGALEEMGDHPEATGVRKLLAQADPESAGQGLDTVHQTFDSAGANDTPNSQDGTAGQTESQQGDDPPALTIPVALDVNDTVTKLLMASQFEQALARTQKILENDNRQIAMRLYQRGLAQLSLAQASGENKQYLDAGLSFMSVLAYFPHSSYAGPSLVEVGVVHKTIGRPDTAKSLYEKAALVLDAEQEPRYADRLEQLINDLDL